MVKAAKPCLGCVYDIGVIDVGSPKLGRLGWCIGSAEGDVQHEGVDLDRLIPHIATHLTRRGLILGLEAPLFVPVRTDVLALTKGRLGEGRRPWSAGAGAQVLALNLPIMIYLLQAIKRAFPTVRLCIDAKTFGAQAGELLLFEALVSGADKGDSHVADARIMLQACLPYAQSQCLPVSILQDEPAVMYCNLAAMAALHSGLIHDVSLLHCVSPIYQPSAMV